LGESTGMDYTLVRRLTYLPRNPLRLLTLAALCFSLLGCSDDSSSTPADTGVGEAPISEAGVKLWPCNKPGQPCNAHDSCAINPICGDDGWCRAEGRQNCDDGLECTDDSCGGNGLCINEPQKGSCALLVKQPTGGSEERCFKAGDVNPADPCRQCNPDQDGRKWTGREGGNCDDDNPCTVNDTCRSGFCDGDYYGNKCNDQLSCTEDVCDGKGGCSNKLKTTTCLIKGACYKQGEASADGCARCDPTNDQFKWTPLTSLCTIGASCYAAGAFDSTGCGVCDPTQDKNGWSSAPNTCLIQGQCFKAGAKAPAGCASCDPTKSTSAFTPDAGKCLISGTCYAQGDTSASGCSSCEPSQNASAWTPITAATTQTATFETGLDGYTVSAPVNGVGWQSDGTRAKGGTKSLYYGNPTTKSYASGTTTNSGSATSAAIALPAGQKAQLGFWLYLDAEASDGFDVLTVKVGTQVLWTKSKQTLSQYRSWLPISVDLSAFAGQTINVIFEFDTKDGWGNSGEGVFIDDVSVITSCGAI
jgi:hypothetical protein